MPSVKEQLSLGFEYGNGKAELRDAAATDNKALPVHRWVPWIAGFSAQFVEDAIDAYLPRSARHRHTVLDPFAGVGTTAVEALKAGCHTTGFEINAFAWLAAKAKVNCTEISPRGMRAKIDSFRDAMTDMERRVDGRWAGGDEAELAPLLRNLGVSRPGGFRSRIPFFSPPVETKFLFALHQTGSMKGAVRDLFRAALGATMVSFSNYSYEPSLSSRPGAGKPLIENASVALAVCRKLDSMLEDIELVRDKYGETWSRRRRRLVQGSYFDGTRRPGNASLVVTSPPYMNNYHYVRNTRPQLHWLGLLADQHDLKRYEQESFGKFWQTVRQDDPVKSTFDLPSLEARVEELRRLNTDRGPYGGPGWANYVVTYFNDCRRLLQTVKRDLKPGGRAVIVVGNSIVQGMEFKVDQLLAAMSDSASLRVEDIHLVRTKRVGNSIVNSTVRRNGNGIRKKSQLYDAAVVLRA